MGKQSRRPRRRNRRARWDTAGIYVNVAENTDAAIPGCAKQPWRFSVFTGPTLPESGEVVRGYAHTPELARELGQTIGKAIYHWREGGPNDNPILISALAAATSMILAVGGDWQVWAQPDSIPAQVVENIGSALYSVGILNARGVAPDAVAAMTDEEIGTLRRESEAQLRAKEAEALLLMRLSASQN